MDRNMKAEIKDLAILVLVTTLLVWFFVLLQDCQHKTYCKNLCVNPILENSCFEMCMKGKY